MKNSLFSNGSVFLVLLMVVLSTSCDFFSSSNNPTEIVLINAEKNLNKYPDSTLINSNKLIKHSLKKAIDDEDMLALLQLKQQAFFRLKKMDSVYIVGEEIREVASRIPDSLAIANTLLQLYEDVDYKYIMAAKDYLPGAIETFEINKMQYEKGIVLKLYGMILNEEGNYKNSHKYLLKASKLFETYGNIKDLGIIYKDLGINFACSGIIDKSNLYYLKALKIAQIRKDSIRQASVLLNSGINYKFSNPSLAINLYDQALNLLPVNKGEKLRMKLEFNRANIYFNQNNFNKAEEAFKVILSKSLKNNYQEGVVMATAALGNSYASRKQYALSVSYYEKALKKLQGNDQNDIIFMILPDLIKVYESSGDYKKALNYFYKLQKLNDSLLTIEKAKAILELEKKYQTEKKVVEIVNLKSLSNTRLLMLYGLFFFVIILFFILKKQRKLYREKQYSYALLMQQYKLERLEKLGKNESEVIDTSSEKETTIKEDQSLFVKLKKYYEIEKPYLNSKLKASDVAKNLQVPQRTISAILKVNGFSSFNNFNNKYRIEEVKKIFENPSSEVLKMEVIASQAGFGNKQSFYLAFEEYTGLNPGFYRSEILK